jgi:hypothetical protein
MNFKILEPYPVNFPHNQKGIIIENPYPGEYSEVIKDKLRRQTMLIDGVNYSVEGIEMFATIRQSKGVSIGLILKPLFCICCGEEGTVKILTALRTITLGEHEIEGTDTYRKCSACNEEWGNSGDPDILEEVYKKYELLTGKKWEGSL